MIGQSAERCDAHSKRVELEENAVWLARGACAEPILNNSIRMSSGKTRLPGAGNLCTDTESDEDVSVKPVYTKHFRKITRALPASRHRKKNARQYITAVHANGNN